MTGIMAAARPPGQRGGDGEEFAPVSTRAGTGSGDWLAVSATEQMRAGGWFTLVLWSGAISRAANVPHTGGGCPFGVALPSHSNFLHEGAQVPKQSSSWAVMLAFLTGSTMAFAAPLPGHGGSSSDGSPEFTLRAILGETVLNAVFQARVHKLLDQDDTDRLL